MNVPAIIAEETMVILIDHPRLRLEAPVRSLPEASAIYARMRDASGEGGSTFPPGAIFIDGIKTHRISYNARAFGDGMARAAMNTIWPMIQLPSNPRKRPDLLRYC